MRPCHWGYGRPLPCRLDHRRLRRRFRRLPSLALVRPESARGSASARSLPNGWSKVVRQGRTKSYSVYQGPDGHVCYSVPEVHRYLASIDETRHSATTQARQAPASADETCCDVTDPADGIPGMPPQGSRCGACRQGCTVVSINGFHQGLCSHMIVTSPRRRS